MTARTPPVLATQIYQVLIKATPQAIWDGITRGDYTARYFHGACVETTGEAGTPIRMLGPEGELWGDEIVQVSEPPRRLVVGWRSLYDPELAVEGTSRVTWEIEPREGGVCLVTLVHDQLEGAPKTAANVSGEGWMGVLSGLKTLLETGHPMERRGAARHRRRRAAAAPAAARSQRAAGAASAGAQLALLEPPAPVALGRAGPVHARLAPEPEHVLGGDDRGRRGRGERQLDQRPVRLGGIEARRGLRPGRRARPTSRPPCRCRACPCRRRAARGGSRAGADCSRRRRSRTAARPCRGRRARAAAARPAA